MLILSKFVSVTVAVVIALSIGSLNEESLDNDEGPLTWALVLLALVVLAVTWIVK